MGLNEERISQHIKAGVDIVDVIRHAENLQIPEFLEEFCTPEEISYCRSLRNPNTQVQCFAARFAAKEAVIKALGGSGPEEINIRTDINIRRLPSGQPVVELTGRAKLRADELGVTELAISMSHTKTNAIAFCVAMFEQPHLT